MAQTVQKLKNNEPRPKFTGSYIKKRVPQGTLLVPLLFLLFIDDIETNIDSRIRLFADDCLVHRVIKKDSDCLQLQGDISLLCHWGNTWKMTFNRSKCRVMHMTHKNPVRGSASTNKYS